jgi:hypothetical protein
MTNAELMTNDKCRMAAKTTFRHSAFVIRSCFVIRISSLKKYRPPRPMGVKGGCSPQNNLGKLRC